MVSNTLKSLIGVKGFVLSLQCPWTWCCGDTFVWSNFSTGDAAKSRISRRLRWWSDSLSALR